MERKPPSHTFNRMITMMRRRAFVLVWLCVALGAPSALFARTPPPNVYRSLESGKPVHAAGEIRGLILRVDYPAGELVVRQGRRSRTVSIVPSTTIYHRGQYATMADLRSGQHVVITVYEVGGRLVAQTIRI